MTSKAMAFFGKTLTDNILKDYRRKKFPDQKTLERTLTWDNKQQKLFAPLYFQTLVKGQGRKPGRGAPVQEIRAWVRRKRIQFRSFVTGRFLTLSQTSFLVNKGLRERGSQVYRNKRVGIDLARATNDALDKSIGKFGDEIIANF